MSLSGSFVESGRAVRGGRSRSSGPSFLPTSGHLARLTSHEALCGRRRALCAVHLLRVCGRARPRVPEREAARSGGGAGMDRASRRPPGLVRRSDPGDRLGGAPGPRSGLRPPRLVPRAARLPHGGAVATHCARRGDDVPARIRACAACARKAARLQRADLDRSPAGRHAAAGREQPGARAARHAGDGARGRDRPDALPALRDRPRSVRQRLHLDRERAPAAQCDRCADDRRRGRPGRRDRADRRRAERGPLLLDRDAGLPAPRRLGDAGPHRGDRGGGRRRRRRPRARRAVLLTARARCCGRRGSARLRPGQQPRAPHRSGDRGHHRASRRSASPTGSTSRPTGRCT